MARSAVVSVLVPTYQHAPFIAKCLDGILRQRTSFPFEVLVGEDGSTDGTREICQRYAAEHPDRIRLFLRDRKDVMVIMGRQTGRANLKQLLQEATGKYIAICEGDDYWTDPLKLQKQYDYLERHPECVLAHHDAFILDHSEKVVMPSKLPKRHQRDNTSDELQRAEFFILTLSAFFRSCPVLRSMPPEFDKVLNGDSFLFMLLGEYGCGHYMPEVEPAAYRKHEGGMWSSQTEVQQVRVRLNTYLWMAVFHAREQRFELASHFVHRANDLVKEPFRWNEIKYRNGYRWFSRVMGWFGVSFPR